MLLNYPEDGENKILAVIAKESRASQGAGASGHGKKRKRVEQKAASNAAEECAVGSAAAAAEMTRSVASSNRRVAQ